MIDPSDLPAAARTALETIAAIELRRRRNGYGNPNGQKITLKMAEKLEAMKLARRIVDARRGADIIIPTGTGKAVVDIIKARRARRQGETA